MTQLLNKQEWSNMCFVVQNKDKDVLLSWGSYLSLNGPTQHDLRLQNCGDM